MNFISGIRKGFLFATLMCVAFFSVAENSAANAVYFELSPNLNTASLKSSLVDLLKNAGIDSKEKNNSTLDANTILISIGERAFSKNIKNNKHIKHHLAFYISNNDYQTIKKENPDINNISAVFSGQSLQRQWQLAQLLLPKLINFSTLETNDYSPAISEQHRPYLITNNFIGALNDALRETDLLIAEENPNIYSSDSIRRILLSSYRLGTPVIGPNKSIVKAGALATVYSNKNQILEPLTKIIKTIQDNKKPHDCFPKEFDIDINEQVAKSFAVLSYDKTELISKIQSAAGEYCE